MSAMPPTDDDLKAADDVFERLAEDEVWDAFCATTVPQKAIDAVRSAIASAISAARERGAREARLGPNHKCSSWRHSGEGYNRVRLCACGAEDHDPEPGTMTAAIRARADK